MTLTIKIPNVDGANANLIIAWDKFYNTSSYETSMATPAPMKYWQKMWLQKSDFVFIFRQVLQHQLLTPQRGGQPNRKNFTVFISYPWFIMFGIIMVWNHDIWPKLYSLLKGRLLQKDQTDPVKKAIYQLGFSVNPKVRWPKQKPAKQENLSGEPWYQVTSLFLLFRH